MAAGTPLSCLPRLLQRPPPAPSLSSRVACSCFCKGRRPSIHFPSPATTTCRGYAKQAPTVRRQKDKLKGYGVSREEISARARLHAEYTQRALENLEGVVTGANKTGHLLAKPAQVRRFVDGLLDFPDRLSRIRHEYNLDDFGALLQETGVSIVECPQLALVLRTAGAPRIQDLAKRLLFTSSALGNGDATELILQEARTRHRIDKKSLYSIEFDGARQILEESKRPTSMVLDGQILMQTGEKEKAIQKWEDAMQASVDNSKKSAAELKEWTGSRQSGSELLYYDLETPWIDLGEAYLNKGDREAAERNFQIGCDLGDPISHYQMASFHNQSGKAYGSSSKWLFHCSKAAASGHARAAHELALYYAETGWPYLTDEPPDNEKPTPFDSYGGSFFDRLPRLYTRPWQVFGFLSSEDVGRWQAAAYPTTPEERILMAIHWLGVGMACYYAPSYLLMAQLRSQKTIRGNSCTPRDALKLKSSRYTYKSRAEYLAGPHIDDRIDEPEEEAVENKHHNDELAKEAIREVLYAARAQRARMTAFREMAGGEEELRKLMLRDRVEDLDEDFFPPGLEEHVRKWFRFSDVRSKYSDDAGGRLYDPSRPYEALDLEAIAIDLCEEHGYDIYGHDDSLMYRHGVVKSPRSRRR